jgi:hypothetical protein
VKLEDVIEKIMAKHKNDSSRLATLADYAKERLEALGLPGTKGGTGGELTVEGLGRSKDWDVAYEFVEKYRLLISLKSIWKNASGVVPNRLDDLMGEAANIQQLRPEVVIGYILVFDIDADSQRAEDGVMWSNHFENAVRKIAVRRAPLWNQGLLEGTWFIRIDSKKPYGQRLIRPEQTEAEGESFFLSLLVELKKREPAIPFTKIIPISPPTATDG